MQSIVDGLAGHLSTQARIWTAIGPAIIIAVWFLGGFAIYGIRVVRRGQFRDQELADRGSSVVLSQALRMYFSWVMQPPLNLLMRLRIPPNAVTTLSFLVAMAAAVALASGRFALGGWLFLGGGALDFVDGRLARLTNQVTRSGAALDSVLDRYSEGVIFMGLAWFYRDTWVLFPVLVALIGSMMVSYVRARGEGLGVDIKVGLMQRPERIVVLGGGVALSPIVEALWVPGDPHPIHRLAVLVIVIVAVMTHLTAAQRFVHLSRKLDGVSDRISGVFARGSIARTTIAALLATAVDFAVVVALVQGLALSPWLATGLGCVVGGVTNFTILRVWAFATRGSVASQAGRYTMISVSSALLNAGGVAVLLLLPSVVYPVAWLIARVVVFVGWNHPLQRDFVFETGGFDDGGFDDGGSRGSGSSNSGHTALTTEAHVAA